MQTPNACRWTSTAALMLVLTAVMVAAAPEADAQTPAPANAPEGGSGDASGDQPQVVSTSGGTFWNSVGYLLVTLLVGGSLYAVCRSSHRT
jgi:hypothetical protein